jgi:hypothetical protein
MDHYFPRSVKARRLTQANFDFKAICDVLAKGVVSEVCLPRLQPDWDTHRMAFANRYSDAQIRSLHNELLGAGVYVQMLKGQGQVFIHWVGGAKQADWVAERVAVWQKNADLKPS